MEDCIFCRIIKGEIPAHKVYEDETVFAFLDIHPIRPGHTLVIPKHHEPDFYNLPDQVYAAVMKTVKALAHQVNAKMQPEKVGVIIAGWDVPHAHVHIVPMHEYQDITSKRFLEGGHANPAEEELRRIAEMLRE